MKAHGLIERDGSRNAYRLTDNGRKVALLFVLFHQRVCGPLANSLFNQTRIPSQPSRRRSKQPIEKPTNRFSTSLTFSPREYLNSERKILRLVHQEPRTTPRKTRNTQKAQKETTRAHCDFTGDQEIRSVSVLK
jgi:hypothetical protein